MFLYYKTKHAYRYIYKCFIYKHLKAIEKFFASHVSERRLINRFKGQLQCARLSCTLPPPGGQMIEHTCWEKCEELLEAVCHLSFPREDCIHAEFITWSYTVAHIYRKKNKLLNELLILRVKHPFTVFASCSSQHKHLITGKHINTVFPCFHFSNLVWHKRFHLHLKINQQTAKQTPDTTTECAVR